MEDSRERVIYFAETDHRDKRVRFGIKEKDRDRHMYVIGKTGMGKSTTLENMAIQDMQNGSGIGFIDPHGGSAELLLSHVPKERIKDVIYFAPFDTDYPISFNVMEDVGKDQRHLVADGLMAAFKKIWPDVWSARMEYILNNILLALIEYPDSSLLGVNRMLADKNYRDMVVNQVTDPAVRAFWLDEFAKYTDRYMQEAGAAIQNKIGQFVSSPIIRNIIGQSKSSFDIRQLMDSKKIVIMNLSKGRMGENNASLLGGMLITKWCSGAMPRASANPKELAALPHFYFYVDEFQSFVNESFANILSEARKYKLNLTIAHQYVEQMPEEVRDAVFGNVGTTIAFRVGPLDAELLEKVFAPKFLVEDIVNLGRNQIYLSLMIDGIGSPPFSARTLPPFPIPAESYREEILAFSRNTYAHPRDQVEHVIKDWHETTGSTAAMASQSSAAPRPSAPQSLGSAPVRPSGLSSTSGAAKRRKRNENTGLAAQAPGVRPGIRPAYQPPRPYVPLEAMKDLGSSNLKSLIEDALKKSAENDAAREDDEDDGLVYKPETPGALNLNQPNESDDDSLEEVVEDPNEGDNIPPKPNEISSEELRKILSEEN